VTPSPRNLRIALALGALALAAGCAAPRPAPPAVRLPPPPEETPTEEPRAQGGGLTAEVARLRGEGDYAGVVARLREEIASDAPALPVVRLRRMVAENLEAGGSDDEATVEYALLTGSSGAEERAAAWDGLARIRERAGDGAGATRARIHAWGVLGHPTSRLREVRRAVESLETSELRALESELRLSPTAHELVVRELSGRGEGSGADEAVIVVLAPITGRFEQFGAAFRLGAELALRERDARSPEAARVRLVVRDTQGDIAPAVTEARRAVVEDGAFAILGPLLSAPALAAGGVAASFRVPLVAPTATDPAVRSMGPYVLPLDAIPREVVDPLVEMAVDRLGGRRFGALVPSDGVSDIYEREFRTALEARGAELALSLAFEPDESDFRRLLERFSEAGVDGVYVPGSASELEALAPQLDFYEFDRRILGNGDWLSPRLLDPGNLALEGALFAATDAEVADSQFMLHLRDLVWRESRQEVSRFHVRGWQAMEAVLDARDGGATDPEALVAVLRHRAAWAGRPESETVRILTYRDGVLGPAQWAEAFNLEPKKPAEPADEGDDASGSP